jgi:hypothetical protein
MTRCRLVDIVDPDESLITSEHWDALFDAMRESSWYQHPGRRMGFINLARGPAAFAGYFANEGEIDLTQYDDNKRPIEAPPSFSFEHLFFALFTDTAQLLLQSRRISGYVDLSLTAVRTNFLGMLTDLFRSVGVYVVSPIVQIDSAGITYTQEQLYNTFREIAQVVELRVSGLHNAALPALDDPRYSLFNPEVERDLITWGAVADTLQSGLDSVTMSAPEDGDATLQSPIPKALAAVGDIDRVRGSDREGRVIFRERVEDADLVIELPVPPEVTPALLERILEHLDSRGRVANWQERNRRRRASHRDGLFGNTE